MWPPLLFNELVELTADVRAELGAMVNSSEGFGAVATRAGMALWRAENTPAAVRFVDALAG